MRRPVLMPALSDATDEGIVVAWFAQPGALVGAGELIAQVQVEKTSADVHAPAAGRLAEIVVPAGAAVRAGEPIAVVDTEPAAAPAPPAASSTPAAAPSSPSARRLARELGVDIGALAGSGPGGRIVEADVRAAAQAGGGVEPLGPMRRMIAARLTRALQTAAQLTLTAEADVTALIEAGGPVTAAAVRASAVALHAHPRLGARLTERGRELPAAIDIGVAVALDDGLVVPVIRAADGKDLPTLAQEIAAVAERARTNRLTAAETQGAVFGVTNLGAHRVDAFTPLLDLPQTAVLGLGRARARPAVVHGAVVPRMLMALSLTFDHRVVDGEPAAAFLDDLVVALEHQRFSAPGNA
jgi:pyruvate/2-oxoglutarate dehydrogenase complex dihydrolipoamide acyltransferase (E2) component